MPVLESKLDVRGEAYQRNRADMLETLDEIQALLDQAAEGGGPEAAARLASRNKMPVRERISHILDRDSPFLEISPLAAWRS
ncbi:MAG: acyl-CoA carboxylase subunit beta, partial [Gammaproteobacteria bacterium]|nr:acyl-CoA carboxylase subunit beta [Gammaproteobacteria bacterium]